MIGLFDVGSLLQQAATILSVEGRRLRMFSPVLTHRVRLAREKRGKRAGMAIGALARVKINQTAISLDRHVWSS